MNPWEKAQLRHDKDEFIGLFYGEDIRDMNRRQLLALIKYLMETNEQLRTQYSKDMDALE